MCTPGVRVVLYSSDIKQSCIVAQLCKNKLVISPATKLSFVADRSVD